MGTGFARPAPPCYGSPMKSAKPTSTTTPDPVSVSGTLPVAALAQRAGMPVTRGDGFAAVLRQLLNYDGVQVLETLPDGRTLRLHEALLREQFALGAG